MGEIIYPFPNFNGCIAEVWEVWQWMNNFTPHIIVDEITHSCCNQRETMLVKWVTGRRPAQVVGNADSLALKKIQDTMVKVFKFSLSICKHVRICVLRTIKIKKCVNVGISIFVKSCGIHLRAISLKMLEISIMTIWTKLHFHNYGHIPQEKAFIW